MTPYLLLLPMLFVMSATAQQANGDTLILHKEKYPNGKLSAYTWLLQSTGNGHAACWDQNGKVMFESDISRNHGHHSVYFEHHTNKVVKKVEESSAPDAGIQWYRSYYYYDENGVKTGESHDGYDNSPARYLKREEPIAPTPTLVPMPETPVIELKVDTPPTPVLEWPANPDVPNQCAIIYQNELWFTNTTKFKLFISFAARGQVKVLQLKPGESGMIDNLIQAQYFSDPMKEGIINITPISKSKKASRLNFKASFDQEMKKSDSAMKFKYTIGEEGRGKS